MFPGIEGRRGHGEEVRDYTRRELLEVPRGRYQDVGRAEKGRILDEFTEVTGCPRKYALRLLDQKEQVRAARGPSRRVYYRAVRVALVVL